MDLVTRQKQRIRVFCGAERGNKAKLVKVAGITAARMTGCEEDAWNPRSDTLAKLVRALDQIEAGNGMVTRAA